MAKEKSSTNFKIINDYSNRRHISAFHPPCWCLRPWEIAFAGQPFGEFERLNEELDEDFKALWILVFEHDAHPLVGQCILPRDVDLPSTQLLFHIYSELTALQRVAIETANGRLGLLMAEGDK